MNIHELTLKNFKGYDELNIQFSPRFNLIIGANGSGKTAVLEALNIALGSFFLGIRDASTKGISDKHIRIATFTHSEEYQFPVEISATGTIAYKKITWQRTRSGMKNSTTNKGANTINYLAKELDAKVRKGEHVDLPVLAYFSTGRLFDKTRDNPKAITSSKSVASRLRAYNKCLDAKSTYPQFISWFKGKEMSKLQRGVEDTSFNLVKGAIVENIPCCEDIYYEFNPDLPGGLKMAFDDGRILPFSSLSDGTRNYLAIVADLAYKCTTLNPHHGDEATKASKGVVLIDELDLHLHPGWQRRIVSSLRDTFPGLQFICTTHSPFLIQTTEPGELIMLDQSRLKGVGGAVDMSVEDIAEDIQGVSNPQWSIKRQELYQLAEDYYRAVSSGEDISDKRALLNDALKRFETSRTAVDLIEQQIIVDNYKKSKL